MTTITKLKNGLKVVLAPVKGTKTITVLVMIKTGSKYENKSTSGLSHFLEHMFFKGTEKRPTPFSIVSELDSIGGEHNAFTGKEYTGYYIKVSKDKLTKALDMLSDMLLHSKFSAEEIEKERGVIIEELHMYEDNPMMSIEDLFENLLYGDCPAGWDTIGTKENILNFKREDFIKYVSSQYGLKSTVICLAGDVKKSDISKLNHFFKELKSNAWKNKEKVVEKQIIPQYRFKAKKTDQITLSLGVRTKALGHKDEYTLKLLAIILGGSMSSRLFMEIREKQGLAYFLKTTSEFYSDSGYLTTEAGIKKVDCLKAIVAILAEYKKITKDGVSKEELQKVKDMIKGRLDLQLEASDNVAEWCARQMVTRGKIISILEFIKRINRVKAEDIKRVAKEIFVNSGLNLALIGEVSSDFEENLKKELKF
ncbi:MAG: insulinase family protein [Planctomycetes bacterium]|jgi:predicted Zn-dependent peptidase|nr:insulinase family protein [Planctomycetota bacterium]